jgi:membrane-bound serine protease (ClpP class)
MMTTIVALYVGGMLLLLSELVMPGLVCGILGSCMVVAAMWFSWREYPDLAWPLVLGELFLGLVLFSGGVWAMPMIGTRLGWNHTKNMDPGEGYVNVPEQPELIGREGVAEGMLRPAGIVLFGDERRDVVTTGEFIEAHTRVRVVAVEGNRVVVERVG